MTYLEKLKDPRWQRKRKEIIDRDKSTCTVCGDTESQLHVHHGYYKTGKEPWEYDNNTLHTLCEYCHGQAEDTMERIRYEIALISVKDLLLLSGIISRYHSCPNRRKFKFTTEGVAKHISEVIKESYQDQNPLSENAE